MTNTGYINMQILLVGFLLLILQTECLQNSNSKFRKLRNTHVRTGTQSNPYIITTYANPPFLMQKPHTNRETGNELYYGFVPDFVKYLSKELDFSYILRPADAYGVYIEATGKWTGMIGKVVDEEADFAIADLTITHSRHGSVEFSIPFITSGVSLLMKKDTTSSTNMSPWVFLAPFEAGVWTSAFIAFLGLSIALFLLGRFSPADWFTTDQTGIAQRTNQFNVSNTLFFMSGSLAGQNTQLVAKGLSTRLISITWWIFCFFATAMYVANLAAILVHHMDVVSRGPKIQTVEDLIAQSVIKYGTLKAGSTKSFFQFSQDPLHQRIYATMESAEPSVYVDSYQKGIELVQNGSYALFMESTSIEYLTERDCDLSQVGGLLDYKGYGIALHNETKLRTAFNLAILNAQENGTLRALKNKWFKAEEPLICLDHETVNIRGSLMMRNFGGIFTVLLVGVGLSVLIGFFEMLWRARAASQEQGGTISAELKREARYAIFGGVTPNKATSNTRTDEMVLNRQDN